MTKKKNITETNQKESEAKYKDLVEMTSDWIWEVDENTVYTYVSPKIRDILGYEPEEILGKTPFDLMSREEAERVIGVFGPIAAAQKYFIELENTNIHKDGHKVILETSGVPIFDEDGKFHGYRGIDRDITNRKNVEELLKFTQFAMDNAADAVFWMNKNGEFSYVNQAASDILGYTREELTTMYTRDINPDHPPEAWPERWLEVRERGSFTFESRFKAKDGRVIPVEITANHIVFDNKEYNCAFARDISERKKAEEDLVKIHNELEKRVHERTADLKKANIELQSEIEKHKITEANLIENEKRFRAAATTTADLIWEGDTRENILNWHGDIDGILGYENGEFPRTIAGHMDNIHPEDRDGFIKAVEKAIESGEDFFAEYRIKCKNGDYRCWDERGRAIGFENGKAVKWVGSITDITERKLSQDLLLKNEEKYRKLSKEFNTLLDAIPDRLVQVSADLKILWSNRAFDLETNNKCDQDCGQHCYSICCGLPSPCNNCPAMRSFQSGKEESAEVLDSDGRVFDKRAFPLLDSTGQVISVIEVSRDITDKKRMEEEAQLVQSRLIQANKMTSLGTLVSGVAHEINNPNSYIMSNSQVFSEIWNDAVKVLKENHNGKNNLLLGGIPFDELIQLAPRLIDGINEGSVRINKIIQSLKNFSRPDKSSLDGKLDIKKVIMSSRIILDNHINQCTNNFHVDISNNIPVVSGSSQQIEQVIINLIMNALQSLTDKESAIRISAYFNEEHNNVVIKVKDEGRGMSDDIINSVTEPFFTTRIDEGGTGLGLSISYTIIKDHNGVLLFESAKDRGTTVTVKLPA